MAAALQHWVLDEQRESHGQIHSCMCPGSCKTYPFPWARVGTVAAVAEQEEAGVCMKFWIRVALQNTALMVMWLVEMNTMAELSPGANITGLGCVLCIYGLIAEEASFCHAGNVRGDAATCFAAILAVAPAACPLCCPGLQGAEDSAFLTSCSWGGGRGKNPKVSKDEWVLPSNTGGVETPSPLPPVFQLF